MAYFLLLIVLASGGAAWAVWSVMKLFLGGGGEKQSCYVVLPVAGHVEDIELRVRQAVRNARRAHAALLIADFGADAETADLCRRLCRAFPTAELLDGSELEKRVISESLKSEE